MNVLPFLKGLWQASIDAVFPPKCLVCSTFYARQPSPGKSESSSISDRHASRKPRPEGRGRGELSQNGKFPFREAPPGRAGRLHIAASYLCKSCRDDLTSIVSPLCSRCGLPFISRAGEDHTCLECLTEKRYFRKARAFGVYEGSLMEAIHRLKYGGKTSLSRPLGALAKDTFCQFWDDGSIDLVLPVPLHIKRLRKRGFNQAHLVSREWAKTEGVLFDGFTLSRSRLTEPQTNLARSERRKNVKGAFSLRHPERIKGQKIVLVDDVFTNKSMMLITSFSV